LMKLFFVDHRNYLPSCFLIPALHASISAIRVTVF